MAKKQNSGLGRGLDSLIPKIEDIETDVEEGVSLEDILKKSEDKTLEEASNEKEEIAEESVEEEVENELKNLEEELETIEETELEDEVESGVESEVEDEVETNLEDELESEEETSNYTNIFNNDDEKIPEINASENDDRNIKTTVNLIEEEDKTIKINEDKSAENELGSLLSEKEELIVYEVIETVENNPRITLWSARSAAVLRYLRKTEPEFSISNEASNLIDEAIAEKYPEIWTLFNHL